MGKSFTTTAQGSITDKMLNPIVIDTDCGFDDLIAISALYHKYSNDNDNRNNMFISTVTGIQDNPYRGAAFIHQTFPQPIKVVTGADESQQPAKTVPDWLVDYRKNLNSCMDEGCTYNDKKDNRDARIELTAFLEEQDDNSVDFMCLGPLTNLKIWLTDISTAPLIQQKASSFWIMGGNKPQFDNGESQDRTIKPEFNFAKDPCAANVVLSSPLIADKIFLLPEQSCIDIPSNENNNIWIRTQELAKSRNGLISRILNNNTNFSDFKYDPLCAFVYANPGSFRLEGLEVGVNASTGLVSFAGDCRKSIKFVTDVDGFLPWIYDLIEKEPLV